MKFEYILFNLLVIAGPLILSFDKRVHFYKYWSKLFPSIIISMVLFIFWDASVTNRHWFFNTSHTLPLRLLHLPPGEWLFFITIPYAAIFTWEVLTSYFSNRIITLSKNLQLFISVSIMFAGFALLFSEKEYTAIVLILLGFVILLDLLLKTKLFRKSRTYHFSALLLLMMLIFNGYLTGRPIVLYHKQYMLNFRIFTIPIEDFLYGFALVFLVLIIYEKFKGLKHG